MLRQIHPVAYVLTAEGIERRESRDKGLVTTIFAPVLTKEQAIASRASFEQFGEEHDIHFLKQLGNTKVFSVSGKRQR